MPNLSTTKALAQVLSRDAARKTNPLRSNRGTGETLRSAQPSSEQSPNSCAAVARQCAQFPAFAPLLEELEVAGWSSHRRTLSGNFHDWLMLDGGRMLVAVGQAVGPESIDPTEAALVAQAAWATIRAHAHYVHDAGELLTIAARSLWTIPNSSVQASVAIGEIDTTEGRASLAIAGDCLAWRVRAANTEQLATRQPFLGELADFTYASHTVQLSLRERLVLVADNPFRRPAKLASSVASSFARLDAESHRRMMAADAVAFVRRHYERGPEEQRSPASIVAVRRR
ncbi:MAG: SpoIIE family protein phosphatase [Planctomycetes bacterium]|nr:SpoIIE family protein phosphatase [Planctomycetota bacterium]